MGLVLNAAVKAGEPPTGIYSLRTAGRFESLFFSRRWPAEPGPQGKAAERHSPRRTQQLLLLSSAVLDHSTGDVAKDNGEAAEDCEEDQRLTPAAATFAAAARTFKYADTRREVTFFGKEVVGGDRRLRLNRLRSGHRVAPRQADHRLGLG